MKAQAAQRQKLVVSAFALRTRTAPKPQGLASPPLPATFQLHKSKRNLPPPRTPFKAASAGAVVGPPSHSTAFFQDGWPLWCLLAACGATAQICETHTRWGAGLSAPLISMLCAAALAAGGVIPVDCVTYDSVWRYLMPMAAACFLLETDIQRLASDGGPVLAGFAVGAVGMVLGALVAWWLLREPLGAVGARLAACLCASYVGGSVNFAAVALAMQVPAASLPGAMAADNLMMAAFLAVLMAVPVQKVTVVAAAAEASTKPSGLDAHSARTEKALEDHDVGGGGGGGGDGGGDDILVWKGKGVSAHGTLPVGEAEAEAPPVTAESLSLTLAAAALACTTATSLAEALKVVPLTLLILAAVAAALAATAQWLRAAAAKAKAKAKVNAGLSGSENGKATSLQPTGPAFAGAAQIGTSLMMLFFAVIGASTGSPACLAGFSVLVPFLIIMVAVHWVVIAVLGRGLLRLPIEALLLGSNANIGGSATAAAMAAAKGWRSLIQPAMLAGSLGYAVGTAAGLAVARTIGAA